MAHFQGRREKYGISSWCALLGVAAGTWKPSWSIVVTGEPYTNAEVARMSAGDLTEGVVEGIMTGEISDPTVRQVVALAAVFGVAPSYLIDRGKEPTVLDEDVLQALDDETADAILRESAHLPEREKKIVLGIVRQFAGQPDVS